MKFGTKVHEIFELLDFRNIDLSLVDNKFIRNKVEKFLSNDLLKNISNANIYKEYEFIYEDNNITYHGIIDLMLEYDNNIKLNDGINNVELKLLDINDNVYKTYTLSIIKDSISSSNSDNKENTSNSDDAITTIFLIIISVIIYRKFKKKKHAKSQ